ncbi:glucose-6-phosphate dehydrogenase [Candidatus Uhrbacteria bacterium]|nr:glucose-6-phosphate dehydrogenase [Candidatus Uhrbacteria bacterium]
MKKQRIDIPTILVILGATGDLMEKKIVPALFHLFEKGELPVHFKIVGFSRRAWTRQDFHTHITDLLKKHRDISQVSSENLTAFLNLFVFQQGVFERAEDYQALAQTIQGIDDTWKICTNKLFYLAVPPQYFREIFQQLSDSGLTRGCGPEEGWTRVIVEKPFGDDLPTAEALDELMGRLFKEEQIYRIDHYLAKEMLQNILTFRFSNALFEHMWNKEHIESIHIKIWESLGVEGRGAFYDKVGALRDVGQNHLLQMLALVTMEHPHTYTAASIRAERTKLLEQLNVPSQEEIKRYTYRAQYQEYQAIKNVDPESQTETYFKVRAFLESPRWKGVPIFIESGKRIGEQRKEVTVTFKSPASCLCPSDGTSYQNKVVFRFEPSEEIVVHFWAKKPGFSYELEERTLHFSLREASEKRQYTEEYEKLILDCISGDQTLFINTHEVRAMWRYTDPIVRAWKEGVVALDTYTPDSCEAVEKSSHIIGSERSGFSWSTSVFHEKKDIGIVGLGKMGGGIARRLAEKGWRVHGWNRTFAVTQDLEKDGIIPYEELKKLITNLQTPRVIWLMIPAGKPVDEMLFGTEGIFQYLSEGDIIIDGGNSLYKESIVRAKKLSEYGIRFLDVGTSGGPDGARFGPCLMIGGDTDTFHKTERLFFELAREDGYQFFEGAGAGHFVKMIHNGIEYGMMQALAEGFDIMKHAPYELDLTQVARIYNKGSVVESRLVQWLYAAFLKDSTELSGISGSVQHTGEGMWTVQTAHELGIPAKIIEGALQFRIESEKNPSYAGKVLSALRGQFGKHPVSE